MNTKVKDSKPLAANFFLIILLENAEAACLCARVCRGHSWGRGEVAFFASICLFKIFGPFPPAFLHPSNKLRQCKLQFISWLLWVTPALHRYSLQK